MLYHVTHTHWAWVTYVKTPHLLKSCKLNCSHTVGHYFTIHNAPVISEYNWRVRWKKGVRYFTQNRTLSKTLQISHAVLFRCLKQCSACFFPWSLLPFWDITYAKKHIFPPLGTFCWMKNKRTFCFAKRWSHYNTLIIYYCFISASR